MRRLTLLNTTRSPAPEAPATEAGPTFAAEGLRGEMRRLWAERMALITRFHTSMNHGGNDPAEGDVACERRQEQMIHVADSLCSGIVEQFPARFGP
jgi:hypothetical protein